MNNTTTILMSKRALSAKPQGSAIAVWQTPFNYTIADLNVMGFAEKVGSGHCWRAAIYENGFTSFKKSGAIGSNVVALDFDACPASPFEVARFAASIAPEPNIIYPTYSQNPQIWENCIAEENRQSIQCTYKYLYRNIGSTNDSDHKDGYNFRMIWLLSSMLSVEDYEYIVSALQMMLKKYDPDRSTKDVSRLWFGGNLGAMVFGEETCDTEILKASIAMADLSTNAMRSGSLRNGKRRRSRFKESLSNVPEQDHMVVSGKWWEKLNGICPLWTRFASGEYLDYNERLILFTNLKYLRHSDETSVKQDVAQFINDEIWKGHTFDSEQLERMFSDRTLRPLPIARGTKGWVTVPEYMKDPWEKPVYPLDLGTRISLEELDSWMDENVPIFLSSDGISYFTSQTASGKTERIIRYIDERLREGRKIIYAAPHFLGIAEFAERFEAYSHEYCHVLPQQQLSRKDMMLLQLGLPKETSCPERASFIRDMNSAANGLWVITHQLLSNLTNVSADLVIVDENIEESLIRSDVITQSQLCSILPYLDRSAQTGVLDLCASIQSAGRGSKVDAGFLGRTYCRSSARAWRAI